MSKLPFAQQYFQAVITLVQAILEQEQDNLDAAATLWVKSLAEGGVIHIFGAGHAHLFAEEVAYRAGGLVQVNPIVDYGYTLLGGSASRSTRLERLEGYARAILASYDLKPGEVLVIVSQSGINPGPIEAALEGKKRGLHVIAITSLAQSRQLPSRHSSGKRLFELADVVIDNHIPLGDAIIELRPDLPKVSAVSTVIGAAILQSLVAEVAARLLHRGIMPAIWVSANVPGGDEHNLELAAKYPSRLKPF
jgi:uncharacterized phosphosugar-binding protein